MKYSAQNEEVFDMGVKLEAWNWLFMILKDPNTFDCLVKTTSVLGLRTDVSELGTEPL
ncbi:MAG: hypothetical protein R1F52_03445 [Candidatus Nitrosoabyssus spongiisocia]|nr:MAG: hypothetical protein R1F52_03445 [Nitrosopumilaceae archaeon AB1(1)]